MNDIGKIKSIRLEYDALIALEEGTALPLSALSAANLIKFGFEANIPIFIVDDKSNILWKLEFESDNESIVLKK